MTGKCSILIPSPNVTNNHQYKNAKVLADANAAMLIEEKDLGEDVLAREVEKLLADAPRRAEMERNIRTFAVPEANKLIYNEIVRMVDEYKAKK